MWSKKTGKTEGTVKMIDLAKTHCQATVVAYSSKYRVSKLPVLTLIFFSST